MLGVGSGGRKEGRKGEGSKPNGNKRLEKETKRGKKKGEGGVGLGFSAHPHA